MYYVFVLFIGCYRANLQNILLLHLSEAAVSPVKLPTHFSEEPLPHG